MATATRGPTTAYHLVAFPFNRNYCVFITDGGPYFAVGRIGTGASHHGSRSIQSEKQVIKLWPLILSVSSLRYRSLSPTLTGWRLDSSFM